MTVWSGGGTSVSVSVCLCVEAHMAEQSFQYLTAGDDVKGLLDESLTRHKVTSVSCFVAEM